MYINVKYKSLNIPIKRKRLLECIYNKTQLYAVYFKYKDIDCLKGKGWKKYTMQKYTTIERKAGVAILLLDHMNFRKSNITRSKNRNFVVIERLIYIKRT